MIRVPVGKVDQVRAWLAGEAVDLAQVPELVERVAVGLEAVRGLLAGGAEDLERIADADLEAECVRRGWRVATLPTAAPAPPETPRKRPSHCDGANAKDCSHKPLYTLRSTSGAVTHVCGIHRRVLLRGRLSPWREVEDEPPPEVMAAVLRMVPLG